eukprot:m.309039 g.309039  ORF g.309039 m.309039 type:complete len:245 (+) comp45336_c0_seq1:68-802(+)
MTEVSVPHSMSAVFVLILCLSAAHVSSANDADFFPTQKPTPSLVKPGRCPSASNVPTTIVDPSDDGACQSDKDCGAALSSKKCCESNSPGIKVCIQPQASGRPDEVTSTTDSPVEHPGSCLKNSNIAGASCRETCSSDANCRLSEKCCPNQACQNVKQCLTAGATEDDCFVNNKLYESGEKVDPSEVGEANDEKCICTSGEVTCTSLTTPTVIVTTPSASAVSNPINCLLFFLFICCLLLTILD